MPRVKVNLSTGFYSVLGSGHVALHSTHDRHIRLNTVWSFLGSKLNKICYLFFCLRSANTAEEQKSAALLRQEEHLRLATSARAKYNSLAAAAKQTAATHDLVLRPHQPNSADISFHYSFNFAQQVIIKTVTFKLQR